MTGGTPARVDRRTGLSACRKCRSSILACREGGPSRDVEGGLGAPSRSARDCVPGSQAERTRPCPVAPQIAPKPNINVVLFSSAQPTSSFFSPGVGYRADSNLLRWQADAVAWDNPPCE